MATELLGKKIISKRTVVGTTAILIPSTGVAPGTSAAETGRQSVDFFNEGSLTAWIGDSDVTTGEAGNGYPLAPGASKAFDAADGCTFYARTASGTTTIKSLEGV